jgi:hypothetical protein
MPKSFLLFTPLFLYLSSLSLLRSLLTILEREEMNGEEEEEEEEEKERNEKISQ